MSIPDGQTLMLPVLRLAAEGKKPLADVAERMADGLGLTREERDELLPSGRQRALRSRLHRAELYMSKAGLIASPARSRFVATDKGSALRATAPGLRACRSDDEARQVPLAGNERFRHDVQRSILLGFSPATRMVIL